jgi:hypothetical protein
LGQHRARLLCWLQRRIPLLLLLLVPEGWIIKLHW